MRAGRVGTRKITTFEGIMIAIFAVFLLVLSAVLFGSGVASASNYCAQTCNGTVIEPNPSVAGNVTIATHRFGDSPLTYPNGSAYLGLNAHVDSAWNHGTVQNPYSINPAGIVATGILQNDKVAGGNWTNASLWNGMSTAAGQHATGPTQVTVNGQTALQWTINATHAAAEDSVTDFKTNIASSVWPSANPQFDYWTEIWEVSSSATCAGCIAYLSFANASANGNGQKVTWSNANGAIAPIGAGSGAVSITSPAVGGNSILWFSASQLQMSSSANLGLNATGPGSTSSLNPTIWVHTPLVTPTPTITVTLVGMAYGTSAITLGPTYWGGSLKANVTRQAGVGNVNLSSNAPSFTYQTISGGSYSVAVSQSAQDTGFASLSQTANANGSETLTYVFNYQMPIATGISYGSFKVADTPRLSAWQYAAVSFGGASYTSIYQTKANVGNYTTIVSSVNPTTAASWVGTITYTPTQWDSISVPPGIFSAGGLQYYWFVLIGIVASALGAIGLSSGNWTTQRERGLRNRRAVQPVPGALLFRLARWVGDRRNLRRGKRGATHHGVLLVLGLVFLTAGGAAVWAVTAGADPVSAGSTFIAGLLVAGVVAVIAAAIYEGMKIARRRKY